MKEVQQGANDVPGANDQEPLLPQLTYDEVTGEWGVDWGVFSGS